jgi:hypothetical protein
MAPTHPLARRPAIIWRWGVNAMTIVVEITSRTGTRAYKEYDALSVGAAIDAANRELLPHPGFRITGFWIDRGRAVQRKPKEEDQTAAISDASTHGEPPWRVQFY